MGQKINPIGLRLGVNRTWDSRWFAGGADYARLLHQDLKLREWLKERLAAAGGDVITVHAGVSALRTAHALAFAEDAAAAGAFSSRRTGSTRSAVACAAPMHARLTANAASKFEL